MESNTYIQKTSRCQIDTHFIKQHTCFHQTLYRQAQEEWTNLNAKDRQDPRLDAADNRNRTKLRMNETKANMQN